MTKTLALLPILSFVTFSAYAKIVIRNDQVYLQSSGEQKPLVMVNELIQSKAISKIKLYGGGEVRMISFAKNEKKEKLYSVDQKGFVYSIEPFTNYTVSKVNPGGTVEFKEKPGRRYKVDKNGYFLY